MLQRNCGPYFRWPLRIYNLDSTFSTFDLFPWIVSVFRSPCCWNWRNQWPARSRILLGNVLYAFEILVHLLNITLANDVKHYCIGIHLNSARNPVISRLVLSSFNCCLVTKPTCRDDVIVFDLRTISGAQVFHLGYSNYCFSTCNFVLYHYLYRKW